MNIIETHDLCKQYGNALRVAHLDLDVPEGSVYGFLGPNGAGKSTTLKMILGLVRPTAGSIRVLGKSMDSKNRLAVLRQVGSLIESPSYYGHLTRPYWAIPNCSFWTSQPTAWTRQASRRCGN